MDGLPVPELAVAPPWPQGERSVATPLCVPSEEQNAKQAQTSHGVVASGRGWYRSRLVVLPMIVTALVTGTGASPSAAAGWPPVHTASSGPRP